MRTVPDSTKSAFSNASSGSPKSIRASGMGKKELAVPGDGYLRLNQQNITKRQKLPGFAQDKSFRDPKDLI